MKHVSSVGQIRDSIWWGGLHLNTCQYNNWSSKSTQCSPAAMKICAAIPTETFISRYAHTILIMHDRVLAMQNPKKRFDNRNLWPRRRFGSTIKPILIAAPHIKITMNTAVTGTSTFLEGSPPKIAAGIEYGGPVVGGLPPGGPPALCYFSKHQFCVTGHVAFHSRIWCWKTCSSKHMGVMYKEIAKGK